MGSIPFLTHPPLVSPGASLQPQTRFWWTLNPPPIAQLVEQIALNDKVLGSIPSGRTATLARHTSGFKVAVRPQQQSGRLLR